MFKFSFHFQTSFLETTTSKPVANVFDVAPVKPTFHLFNTPGTSSASRPNLSTGFYGRFLANPQPFRAGPNLNPLMSFQSQKASTPTDASRKKVLTQEFSFQSTPSTAGRFKRQ